MILLKQYPLKPLDTFEEEMLFLLAGDVHLIAGIDKDSMMNSKEVGNCLCLRIEENYGPYVRFDEEYFNRQDKLVHGLIKLCKKYNKSFSNLFEIRLTKQQNGRWTINIKENMNKVSEEVEKHV